MRALNKDNGQKIQNKETIITSGPIHKEPFVNSKSIEDIDAPMPCKINDNEVFFLPHDCYIDGNKDGGWKWVVEWKPVRSV